MSRLVLSCAVAASILGAVPARAEDKPDEPAFEKVIAAQIDAIGRGDAAAAHSFASPGIQQKFPDPNQFLGMVKQSYGALVKPKSTHFESSGDTGLGPMEKVTIIDSSGVAWTAVYTFEQVDGQWRITGCALIKAPDTSA